MIKILFFIEKFAGGGAEKVLRELVNHMDQTKFNITVQSVWPYEEGKSLEKRIQYKTVYPHKNRFYELLYRLEAAAKLTYSLHIRDEYDLECAFLEMGTTKILAASTNKRARKIAWVHCDLKKAIQDKETFAQKCSEWYKKYDLVACVSQTAKNSFDEIFQNQFPSTVLYNYVDDVAIKTKSEESIQLPTVKHRPIMIAVGTLYPPKNYPRLLNAHKQLISEGIDHELWILGDGVERADLERFVRDNSLSDSVRFFGFKDNPYPYIKRADMLVCSSNYEGYSTVITEALILGKPIVTTECSGMMELLGDSEYGLITENNDEAFYRGVKELLSDTMLREHYAEKAAERGKAFSGADRIQQIQDLFLSICKPEEPIT